MSVLISFFQEKIFHPVGQNSVEWCADVFALLGHCVVSFWADVHCASVSRSPWDKNNSLSISVPAYFLSSAFAQLSASSFRHTHTHTQRAYQNSRKGHLCLPGLPCDKEEAVIGSVNPIGAPLANHHSSPGISTAAVAAVMLQNIHPNVTKSSRCSCRQSVRQIENKPTMRGPPVVPGFSAKTNPQQWEKEAKYTWGNLPVASSIDWFYFLS